MADRLWNEYQDMAQHIRGHLQATVPTLGRKSDPDLIDICLNIGVLGVALREKRKAWFAEHGDEEQIDHPPVPQLRVVPNE